MMSIATVALCVAGGYAQTNTNSNQSTTTTTTKTAKTAKPAKTMPTSDADIQQCITSKLAKAPKLSKDNLQSTVGGGVATLTGSVPDAGSKGGAGSLAKSCGAKSVVNTITVTAKPKMPKPAKEKSNTPNGGKPATTNTPPSN